MKIIGYNLLELKFRKGSTHFIFKINEIQIYMSYSSYKNEYIAEFGHYSWGANSKYEELIKYLNNKRILFTTFEENGNTYIHINEKYIIVNE